MKIGIESNILRYWLRNVYFINGTAYAGKSTMVHMLAERYDMIECGENYHLDAARKIAEPDVQPATCYFSTMSGWEEFLNRSPEEYEKWVMDGQWEIAQFELAELLRLSAQGKKIIVDTNIPLEMLKEISDYDHVAVMLSPQGMSVERFFDRSDPDKQFLLNEIDKCPDPEKTMANFRACLARVNSPEVYARMKNSGFFVHERLDAQRDTREETMRILARHFGLEEIC